jgi:predicted nuclease of predicted toxin-antitoxin system
VGFATSTELQDSSRIGNPLKFLVDANLSWRVANLLRELHQDAEHVMRHGPLKGSDVEIWRKAEREKAIVFTKDTDFLNLVSEKSTAQLLLYRGLNSRRVALSEELKIKLPGAILRLRSGDRIVTIQ